MPRTIKGHNYVNFSWNSLKIKSGISTSSLISCISRPWLKYFLRHLADKVKMRRSAKGRNYINFPRNSLKFLSGNLHIIPTHYMEFQEPNLNTFRDILLTRFNSDFCKGHNSKKTNKYAGQEKNTGQLFFHGEPIYKISKP